MTSRDGFNIFTCKVVKQRQRLTFTTKLQVYKTLVLSVLIAIDMKTLEAFHMKCQRQMLGIRWSDFVSK